MTRDQRISDDARPSTDDIATASHTHRGGLTETETDVEHDEGPRSDQTRSGVSGTGWSPDADRAGTDRTYATDDSLTEDGMTDSDTDDLDLDRTQQSGWRGSDDSMDQARDDVAGEEETRSGDWADSRGATGTNRADDLSDTDSARTDSDLTDRDLADSALPDSDLAGPEQGAVDGRTGDAGLAGTGDWAGAQASEQSAPRASGEDESPAELFQPEVVERFRGEWQRIQGRFVDDPQDAVRGADHLVAEVMQALATMFSEHKHELEGQWQQRSEAETEDLRLALRRYRSFFNQLLSA